jgi:transposase
VWTAQRLERTVRAIDRDIEQYLQQMNEQDAQHAARLAVGDTQAALQALQAQRTELQALAAQMNTHGESQHVKGEPQAKLMRTAQGNHKVAYNVQIAVEAQHHLIVAHELTNAGNDHTQLEPMAKAAQEILQSDALTVIADTGYHNGQQAQACEAAGITPIVPAPQGGNPKGADLYSAEQFQYDAERDGYRCPAGQMLMPVRTDQRNEVRHYSTNACGGCALKAQCTRGRNRTIVRSFYAEVRERMKARLIAQPQLRTLRSCVVEHPFSTLKYLMGTPRFLVRGRRKAAAEIALAVSGYNLKRLIAIMGVPALLEALRARVAQPA